MKNTRRRIETDKKISRRKFFKIGSAAVAGSAFSMCTGSKIEETQETEEALQKIKSFRTLGRTNFKVSDIALGGFPENSDVVRYAYDRGINYFDTADGYGNGESERRIGEAKQYMDRSKIFITTKLLVQDTDTEDTILERCGECRKRLQTDYVDALYTHMVTKASTIGHAGFHAAAERLKRDGRLRHVGVSCHGPEQDEDDSLEKVLLTAVEDGRFDLMLFSYSFLNKEEAEKVLAACKKDNLGTTAMKTMPGVIELDPFDPENPTGDYLEYIERAEKQGTSREEAVQRIRNWITDQEETMESSRAFAEKYGVTTNDDFRKLCLKWVLQNPDMHTVCMSLNNFEGVDTFVPLSGTRLTRADSRFLQDYELAYSDKYCRHACSKCSGYCPNNVPVSTIMRYAQYYRYQGREKYAMTRYTALEGRDASLCEDCDVPCATACPYGVNIRASLFKAHSLLTLA